jgi:hypothetical protein
VDPRTECFVLELSSSQTREIKLFHQAVSYVSEIRIMEEVHSFTQNEKEQSGTINNQPRYSTPLSVEALRVPCVHTQRIPRPKTELPQHMQQRRKAMTECHSGVVIDWRFADTQQH